MTELPTVNMIYMGNVCHQIGAVQVRRIAGKERGFVRNKFSLRRKPFKEYQQRMLTKDTLMLVAGNLNGIGRSTSVLQKISTLAKNMKMLF